MPMQEEGLRNGVASRLDGEEMLAALIASPRMSMTGQMGGAAGLIGSGLSGKQSSKAESAGLVVHRNSGLVMTPTRLLTFALKISMMGKVKEVGEQLSELPLDQVDSLEAKRMGASGVITISANGATFKLESKPGSAKDLEAAFQQAHPTA